MPRPRFAAVRVVCAWLLAACVASCAGWSSEDASPASRRAANRADDASERRAQPPRQAPSAGARERGAAAAAPGAPTDDDATSGPKRDLAADEACGGHTLARHVGRTDAQLAQRLRAERDIAAASTYTDRDTAERIVGAAIAASATRVRGWTARRGRRPNLVLRYHAADNRPIGRSILQGRSDAVPCHDALIVLRWREDRDDFCVLTSYPEVRR